MPAELAKALADDRALAARYDHDPRRINANRLRAIDALEEFRVRAYWPGWRYLARGRLGRVQALHPNAARRARLKGPSIESRVATQERL